MLIILTINSLTKDFGNDSSNYNRLVQILIRNFNNRSAPQTEVSFNNWKQLFSESCGYDFRKTSSSAITLAKKFDRNEDELDQIIFCLHTYFSLIITLIASEVVSFKTKTVFGRYLEFLLNIKKGEFVEVFKMMPSSSIFDHIGLKSFFDGDLFWWFTDEWSSSLEEAIYSILITLTNYEPTFSSIHVNNSKDVFKELYEDLIPRTIRHDLGEYYTPNWITEYVINNIKLHKYTRILDPSCGFGSFLIQAINRIRREYGSVMKESDLLQLISNQIVGFDLNPIAVITARANYLIAIADLIASAGNFTIPIFMRDSILSDSLISVPSFPIEKFDYVVGNPPWIGWENLPQAYRNATQHLWKQYNLFSIKKGSEARLGGGKKDFSMLFVHRSIDLYLKEKGELIFLITQTVFQSVKTGEGFRKFHIKKNYPFGILKVDDLSEIKPFKASAQAAILYCKKGEITNYPIKYRKWRKKERINFSSNSLSFEAAEKSIRKFDYYAQPSTNKSGSPWIIYPSSDKDFPWLMRKLTGKSPYLGKAGVCTWLNGVFWIQILVTYPDGKILIENLGDIGRKKVPIIQAIIEPDLIFPLIRGRDVGLWTVDSTDNYYLLVTNDPVTRKGISISKMKKDYPKTYKYLSYFKDILMERSGYKKYFQPTDPFYSIYNVEQELFAPIRLLWSEMGDFNCSIIKQITDPCLGRKIQIPNNKVMYIPFFNEKEAYFVAGVINSPLIKKFIAAKKLATSNTTKLIKEMKIPKFNAELHEHQQIAKFTKKWANNRQNGDYLKRLQKLIFEIIN